MPHSIRPFSDRAVVDDAGNVTPFDTPPAAVVLEGETGAPALPARLVDGADIELLPFDLRVMRTIASEAAPYRPAELVVGENARRGALTFHTVGAADISWRVARTPHDALRDESSILLGNRPGGPPFVPPLRVAWRQAVWVAQRSGGAGAWLAVVTEDWAR